MKDLHPLTFVESVLSDHRNVTEVHISTYRYHPRALTDDRTTYAIPTQELRAKYELIAAQLDEQEDIAFHSAVIMADQTRQHLPLVDFNTPERGRVEETADKLIREYRAPRAALIHSGRSYHLYLGVLLVEGAWVKFMGRILLLNDRDDLSPIDSRWVGHRLMEGYGALRWSAKVSPCLPTIVRQW